MSHPEYMIRPMEDSDLKLAMGLWRKTKGISLSPDETEASLRRFLERNLNLSTVVVAPGRLFVAAVLAGHDGRRGYIYHLAVSEAHRGRGLGRALVMASLMKLQSCGIAKASTLVFSNNTSGRAFWEHMGWRHRDDLHLMQFTF